MVTLESEARFAAVARANVARAGLRDMVEVRVGRALDTLPALAAEARGPFDLIFIDADKRCNADYLEWALELSRPGTLIVADNVVRDGAVIDATSTEPSVAGVRGFLARLSADPRLSATAIQTVGIKGYDGFALALVTREP
jgi:predicted O-methyltransferase YrrM